MSFLSTAAGLVLIAGAGGSAFAAYTFRAPWWACMLFTLLGFLFGLFASVLYGRISKKLFNPELKKSRESRSAYLLHLLLPFVAAFIVSATTIIPTIALAKKFWPERSQNPRSFELLERSL